MNLADSTSYCDQEALPRTGYKDDFFFFFALTGRRHWHKLHREAGNARFLDLFKDQGCKQPGLVEGVTALGRELE